jgi:hypothetical protein
MSIGLLIAIEWVIDRRLNNTWNLKMVFEKMKVNGCFLCMNSRYFEWLFRIWKFLSLNLGMPMATA